MIYLKYISPDVHAYSLIFIYMTLDVNIRYVQALILIQLNCSTSDLREYSFTTESKYSYEQVK